MYKIIDINDIKSEEYDYYFSLMSKDKKERVNDFRFEKDRLRSVGAELLARKMICQASGIPEEEIIIKTDKNGKPYAENARVYFSISHSEELVICAVSKREIGIDIEKIRDADAKLIDYVCSEKEKEYVLSGERSQRFFEVWTGKEAYYKCVNPELDSPKDIDVFDKEIKERMKTFCFKNYAISIFQ